MRALPICLLAVGAARCGGALGAPPCEDGNCGTQLSTRGTLQYNLSRKLDVLFVVDDTPAIAPHADALAAGFAGMGQMLSQPYGPTSVHAGVIRAGGCDTSTRARACGIAAPEEFLRADWCETLINDTAGVADTVACMAGLGAADCGPIQPLAAAVHALTSPPAGWEGFLRPDAALLIVIVAASDDASGPPGAPTPVADVVARLKALKDDPTLVMASVIGPGNCPGDTPPPRLLEFVQTFGANGEILGLCSAPLSAALDRAHEYISIDISPPCIANVRDTDRETPGLQADCTVESRSRTPDGSTAVSPLPTCDAAAPPCWRFATAPSNCYGGRGWIFEVERPTDWCEEAGVDLKIECLGCAEPNDPACAPAQAQAR
jgi:hypothetical protein